MEDTYLVRKKWNIDLLVGSGFTPLTGVKTSHFSFRAEKDNQEVVLMLDLSINEEEEYLEFVENREGFKYLSFIDMDGMITKDLLTFVKTITGKDLKDISYKLEVKVGDEGQSLSCEADLIYQNELFICRKGIKPSVLK